MEKEFTSFSEFWPFYLKEHSLAKTRWFHFTGTSIVIALFFYALFTSQFRLFWLLPFIGYGPAWYSHFFIEKNRPATFKYPFYSLFADFKLWFLMLILKIR